jgi:hypothetical protein
MGNRFPTRPRARHTPSADPNTLRGCVESCPTPSEIYYNLLFGRRQVGECNSAKVSACNLPPGLGDSVDTLKYDIIEMRLAVRLGWVARAGVSLLR